MGITAKTRIRTPEHVIAQQVEDASVLLSMATETYYGIDDVGTRMWHALSSAQTVGEATTLLLREFDVSQEQLEGDLHRLVGQLVENGLLLIPDE